MRLDSTATRKEGIISVNERGRTAGTDAANKPERTAAEFFAGIGLVRIALERQGWSVRFANDIEPAKRDMYEAHFGDSPGHFVTGDVHDLSPHDVPATFLATASFPCNDLSLAGARQGFKGPQSSAFWGFIRVLAGLGGRRPRMVLLENVTGFLTSHGGRDFLDALTALNSLGYDVDAFTLDAVKFVPQSRPRLFVTAISARVRAQGGPPASDVTLLSCSDELRPKKLREFIEAHPEIHWRLRDFPAPSSSGRRLEDIIEDLPHEAPEWWNRKRAEYLLNQMSARHREKTEAMIAAPAYSYGTVFRRMRHGKSMGELRTDGIAGCLRTPRGGSGRQILLKAGRGEYFARLLTPRECARLMGAGDFRITAPVNQALFGFGDAVCVPVIEWIAQYYLNPVADELLLRELTPQTPVP